MALPLALRALGNRNFRLFVAGQLVSLVGTWMQMVAQSWLVYRLSSSALTLGLVGFSSQLPMLVLSPLGGVVADRAPRRRALIATQAGMMLLAFVLAAISMTETVQIWHVFVLSALLGVINAIDMPTRQAFFVEMVGKADLANAIALNSSIVNGARLVGPALAGVLVAAVGEGWCFLLNGVSFLAVIAGLVAMRVPDTPPAHTGGSFAAHIAEGFGFVARTPPIRDLLLLLGWVSLTGMPFTVLMPVMAEEVLHGGPQAYGLLMSATGVGSLLGAGMLAGRRDVRGLGRWTAAGAAGFGVFLLLFAISRVLWLSALLLVPAGFFMMVQMASSNTLIQSMVPDHLRGRVMSVYAMMFLGMAPFGALFAGALAHPLGSPMTIALGGLGCAGAAAFFGWRLKAIRGMARELIAAQHLAGLQPAAGARTSGSGTGSASSPFVLLSRTCGKRATPRLVTPCSNRR